jgi:hypothetical protein
MRSFHGLARMRRAPMVRSVHLSLASCQVCSSSEDPLADQQTRCRPLSRAAWAMEVVSGSRMEAVRGLDPGPKDGSGAALRSYLAPTLPDRHGGS